MDSGEAKAGYRRANDKGQWWEAGASDKGGHMEVKNKRLADIMPYAANAKKHDRRQINNVAESIKQYGFVQPIVIDREGVIVIGHCRAMAAKKLGMEEVPCVCVDDLTPEQVNALRRNKCS